jgi:radical SAM protein with 4Fe4S-binding SPASM domain
MRTVQDYIRSHPDELAEAYREVRPMRHLEIEVRLDWRCNAKCKFCGVWKYSRDGMLPPERWKEIFTELAGVGLQYTLFTGGEPMLYPHFLDIVEHVDALGVATAIITNGSMLDARRVERLAALKKLREITVSLDSPDAEVHDEVRKMRGLFDRAITGMGRVREQAPQVALTVNTVVAADTADTVHEILTLPVLPNKIRIFPVGLDARWLDRLIDAPPDESWSSWASEAKTQAISAETLARVRDALEAVRVEGERLGVTIEVDRMAHQGPFKGICVVPLVHFVIQPNGSVLPCCHVQNPVNQIGRLGEQSVAEMFDSQEYRDFHQTLRPVRFPACFSCSRYRGFNEEAAQLLASSAD